jgi:hypothetical protein
MEAVQELHDCNFIFGAMPSLEQAIEPEVEREDPTLGLSFADGAEGDKDIVTFVKREEAISRGEIIEIGSDDEDDGEDEPDITSSEIVQMCEGLEKACIQRGELGCQFPELLRYLRRVQATVHQEQVLNAKQSTLETYFTQ